MRKNIIILVMLFSAMSLSAQMYVGFGVGYHMAANGEDIGTSWAENGLDYSNIYGSFGKGILPELRFGYMLNDNWGLEFGLNYLLGSTVLVEEDLSVAKDEWTSKTSMLRFTPQLVFKTEAGLYARTGLYIPLGGKTVGMWEYDDGTTTQKAEVENKGRFSVGYTATVGYSYDFSDNMAFFGELQYIGLRIYSKTETVTLYEVNGNDILSTFDTQTKETEYVDEILSTDNTNTDEPWKSLTSASPYSSLGINIGVYYKL